MSATKIMKTQQNGFHFSDENGNVELLFMNGSGKTAYMELGSYRSPNEVEEEDLWEEPSDFNARVEGEAKEIITIICDVFANETKYSSRLPFQQEFSYNLLVVDVYGIPVLIQKNNPDAEDLFKTWKKMHDEGLGVQYYDAYPEDDPLFGM